MLIRPYTISQIAILLMVVFFLTYLRQGQANLPADQQRHTRWMRYAILWAGVNIFITSWVGLLDNSPLKAIFYLQNFLGLGFWYALSQAIYALPEPSRSGPDARTPQEAATSPPGRRGWLQRGLITQMVGTHPEGRWIGLLFIALMVVEIPYTGFRFWEFIQSGERLPRPPIMSIPILFGGLWIFTLVARRLWWAERERLSLLPQWSMWSRRSRLLGSLHAILFPQNPLGRFYRGFMFISLVLGGMSLLFTSPLANWPTVFLVGLDILVTAAILVALFAYLSSPLAPTGLEIRVMGAGLTLFLSLISVLGWIITLTFLNQRLPGVPIVEITGFQGKIQFFTVPETYRPAAEALSGLLFPLISFAILGSIFFISVYTAYYRTTLKMAFTRIMDAFEQLRQGNLAHRIPESAWRDEMSQISASFNQMAATLQETRQSLQSYQTDLQNLVQQRTDELGREMAIRQRLELRQGIQDERARIAQETHDGLLQSLMGMRIRLSRGKRMSQMEAAAIQAEMQEMADELTQSVQDLRSLINELNEQLLPDGLVMGMRRLIQRHERVYAMTIESDLAYRPDFLTLPQELSLLRVAQEALANASHHGQASRAWVTLGWTGEESMPTAIVLRVRDDGVGFDQSGDRGGGWGLKNMLRRADQMGATLEIQSQPGQGTTVELCVPLTWLPGTAPESSDRIIIQQPGD